MYSLPWLRRMSVFLALCILCAAAAVRADTLTLANSYRPGLDVQAYWVSEKYDGIRAHWDGRQLRSRQGLPIDAPAWFTRGWPAQALDGELWAVRRRAGHGGAGPQG